MVIRWPVYRMVKQYPSAVSEYYIFVLTVAGKSSAV